MHLPNPCWLEFLLMDTGISSSVCVPRVCLLHAVCRSLSVFASSFLRSVFAMFFICLQFYQFSFTTFPPPRHPIKAFALTNVLFVLFLLIEVRTCFRLSSRPDLFHACFRFTFVITLTLPPFALLPHMHVYMSADSFLSPHQI